MTDIRIYILTEDWATHGYADCAGCYYTDYSDAKAEFDKCIEIEKAEGYLSDWLNDDSYICERKNDCLEVWLDNEYLSEHYRLVITEDVLHVSDAIIAKMKGQAEV